MFPDKGPAETYTSHYFDFQIEFISDTNLTLVYRILSTGYVEVEKSGDDPSNTLIFGGSSKKWYNEIKAMFDEKKKNPLWLKLE
ncbi:MAG: hypothetical protein E7E23_15395 [Paenibacillus sp.]|uniref:hypothetical protein n=1 Tax=Paenibacillus sp. TaxID=58172 RepID=UPI0028FF2FEE|nr:hypothetical protein [Paenibacillus sp.]MDU2241952.1 hypothetical protein [Paenibacillus sp.]